MKANKKVLGAAAALTMSLAMAAGSTFAWFTTGNKVSVGQFELGVTNTSGDLLCAVSATSADQPKIRTFKYTLSRTDFNSLVENIKLDALTFNTDNATDNGVTLKKRNGENSVSESYLTFKLWFATRTPDTDVYLYEESTVTDAADSNSPSVIRAWKTEASKYGTGITENEYITARASNATRVAFLNANGTTSTGIWSPNEALTSGGNYDGTGDKSGNEKGYYQNNLASDYEEQLNQNSDNAYKAKAVPANYVITPTAETATKPSTAAEKSLVSLGALETEKSEDDYGYAVGSITVKIWLEGTDGDCFDAIFNDSIAVKLAFVGLVNA